MATTMDSAKTGISTTAECSSRQCCNEPFSGQECLETGATGFNSFAETVLKEHFALVLTSFKNCLQVTKLNKIHIKNQP